MTKPVGRDVLVVVALVAALGGGACTSRSADAHEEGSTVTSTFEVEGMTCGGCELGVTMAVEKLDGVESVAASYEKGEAQVVYQPETVTPEEIVAAIEELGYDTGRVNDGPEG